MRCTCRTWEAWACPTRAPSWIRWLQSSSAACACRGMNSSSPMLPPAGVSYFQRWRQLRPAARLYLLHAALLTSSLAIIGLLFNLAVLALGFSLDFLGLLNTVSFATATLLSVPLLWLVTQVSLRVALLASAALQIASVLLLAFVPIAPALLLSSGLGGAAAVLFQVSAPPFMMRQSDSNTRDHLFSANTAILIGFAGLGSLLAGRLPGLAAQMLGVGAESGLAYRAAFAVAGAGVMLSILPLLLLSEAPDREPPTINQQQPINPQPLTPNSQSPIPDAWRDLLRDPAPLVKLLISPALISIGAALLIPYLNLFFKQRFAVT